MHLDEMGMFDSFCDAVSSVASIPVAVVKDVVTVGGMATGHNSTYTGRAAKEASDKVSDAVDDVKDAIRLASRVDVSPKGMHLDHSLADAALRAKGNAPMGEGQPLRGTPRRVPRFDSWTEHDR